MTRDAKGRPVLVVPITVGTVTLVLLILSHLATGVWAVAEFHSGLRELRVGQEAIIRREEDDHRGVVHGDTIITLRLQNARLRVCALERSSNLGPCSRRDYVEEP